MFRLSYVFEKRNCLVSLLLAFLFPGFASGSCAWSGAGPNFSTGSDISFEGAGYNLLANKNWYDDSRYPIGTLMGQEQVRLRGSHCASLTELAGKRIDVVYHPPVNATRYGTGFQIPTSNPGVAINIEFPNGTPRAANTIFLGFSKELTGFVTTGGILTPGGNKLPLVVIQLSITKTGAFGSEADKKSAIKLEDGLGVFRYYELGSNTVFSASEDKLVFPTSYSSPNEGDYLGHAMSPSCHVNAIGNISLATGPKIITLSSVNTSDFTTGVGAIDKGQKTEQQFKFTCSGTSSTKPKVYFDATYPYNNGVNGVGLPALDSDIGVQILLGGSPVKFGTRSQELGWNVDPLTSEIIDASYGPISPTGPYCKSNCGTDMSNSNWEDGGAASGNNDGKTDAVITFKYYQTKTQAPVPSSFSVPFTVTIDIQ